MTLSFEGLAPSNSGGRNQLATNPPQVATQHHCHQHHAYSLPVDITDSFTIVKTLRCRGAISIASNKRVGLVQSRSQVRPDLLLLAFGRGT